jgi:AcrR family transcriptional regulator
VNSDKRSYRSETRARQARVTRAQILSAAATLFAERGYSRTGVGDVAERAGVTAQTVYNAVGSKAQLLKAAYDVTLAGDDEPVPIAERPDVRAAYALDDAAAFLHAYAALGRRLLERVGPLMLQIAAGAAGGETDLVEHQRVTDGERLVGTQMVIRRVVELDGLRPGLDPELARDRIWTLNSVQVWDLLTRARGWSGAAYQLWVGEAMVDAVLDRHAPRAPSTP